LAPGPVGGHVPLKPSPAFAPGSTISLEDELTYPSGIAYRGNPLPGGNAYTVSQAVNAIPIGTAYRGDLLPGGNTYSFAFPLDYPYNVCYKSTMSPQQIKRIRGVLGLTQQALANFIGASQVSVARWETGVHEPQGANLKALRELEQKAKKGKN